ncbi:MAG: EamA family transporter [Gammaproteobacteria bacterium]|nr:EamA family transporter [Gammaproteobacteria bacterium]MDD9851711.1 EamA family transporter [Gammaproteobacteria bacterium]MDD9870724.1 EamA family transporter [Gammaproteobacteria bacterium]
MLNLFLFAVLCLSWGSTWVAIKVGVDEAPPLWFAGSRFVVAGVLILLLAALFIAVYLALRNPNGAKIK